MHDKNRPNLRMPERKISPFIFPSTARLNNWWPLILAIIGTALLTVRFLYLHNEPPWLSTISDILSITMLFSSLVILGTGGQRGREVNVTETDHLRSKNLEFPFHVIHSFTEMTEILLPDPNGDVLIPDRSVPYIYRELPALKHSFSETGKVLLRGRSKTGKTRAIIEMLREYWNTSPTILVLKRTSELHKPLSVPDDLPRGNLVIIIDDLHIYAQACTRRKVSMGSALSDIMDFFVQYCGNQASEVRIVIIARKEPECWEQIKYDSLKFPWTEFVLVDLLGLTLEETRRLVIELAGMSPSIISKPEIVEAIASSNDGTYYRPILAFRSWRSQPGKTEITEQDLATLQNDLVSSWRYRRSTLIKYRPQLRYIYAALDLGEIAGIPNHKELVSIIAQSLQNDFLLKVYIWWIIILESKIARSLKYLFNVRRIRSIGGKGGLVLAKLRFILFRTIIWPIRYLRNIITKDLRKRRINRKRIYTIFYGFIQFLSNLLIVEVLWSLLYGLSIIIKVDIFRSTIVIIVLCIYSFIVVELFYYFVVFLLKKMIFSQNRPINSAMNFVCSTEIPIIGSTLIPYDLQVDGAVMEFISLPWVDNIVLGKNLINKDRSLYILLRRKVSSQ